MTNDTNYRGKANAVFFAAIMVLSMVAVGFAAAPAAADAESLATSSGETEFQSSNSVTITGTVDADSAYAVNLTDADGNYKEVSGTLSSGATDFSETIALGSGFGGGAAAEGDLTVEADQNSTVNTVQDSLTLTVDDTAPDVSNVQISDSGNTGVVETGEEVSVTAEVTDDNTVDTVEITDGNNPYNSSTTTLTEDGGEWTGTFTADASETGEAENVTVTATDAAGNSGNADSNSLGFGVYSTQFLVDDDSQNIYYQGQDITASGLEGDSQYELRSAGSFDNGDAEDTSFEDEFTTNDDGEYTIDSDNLDAGYYYITGDSLQGDDEANSFELTTQSFDTEFDEDEVEQDEEVDLEIDSNRGSYDLNISAAGDLDEDELKDIFVDNGPFDGSDFDVGEEDDDEITIEGVDDGTYATNFTDIDTGEYEFTFDVIDTEAEDTSSITVTESSAGELNIADSVVEQQGDVAAITIELDGTDTGTLVIGNEEDDGYQANITIEDEEDDEVVVLFNTYTAGLDDDGIDSNNIVSTEDDDADVSLQSESDLTDILDTGTYDLSVSSDTSADQFEETIDDPDTISSLSIEERGEAGLELWRTGENVEEDIADELDDENESAAASLIASAVEDDLVTEGDTLAIDADGDRSDVQVHQISASGLQGPLANASGDLGNGDSTAAFYDYLQEDNEAFADSGDEDRLDIVLEQQNPDSNTEAKTIDLNDIANDIGETEFEGIFTVVYDEDADDYYVVLDTDSLNDNADIDADIEDGDEFEVQVAVQDARLLDIVGDDDEDDFEDAFESASATFSAEEADGSFDNEDEIEVEAAEEQSITGTTNVAPGTEIDVRVRSSDEASTSFIQNDEDIVVSSDGTFEATLDFSDAAVDDTFEAEVRQAAFDATSDGTVVEAVEESATFEVSDLDPEEATATAGDEVTVSATIENTGNAESTQDVALTLDGDEEDTSEITLEAGGSTTVEFTVDTSGLDTGDYEHGVATDEVTATLTVEGADDDSDGSDSSGSDDGTPGFGALVAAVLLATPRIE